VTSAEITKYCKSAMFSEVGKKTPVFVRFSTVGGEKGSPDTVRDPRGHWRLIFLATLMFKVQIVPLLLSIGCSMFLHNIVFIA
jgi:hypothetical protein